MKVYLAQVLLVSYCDVEAAEKVRLTCTVRKQWLADAW